ncbi:MAG TPA: ABC transporter permease [Terriglobia bacterium]|nr:ABC transporter permease [Terriglobia bacterium]
MEFLNYILHNSDRVFRLTVEHLELVGISIFAATVIGVPLGVAASRNVTLKRWSLAFANVAQTVPSLALFGFLIPATGIGARTAVIALALYALLPILRNTCVGIAGVDRAVIEAARGMGMTARQMLWQVELPLAMGVILAGLRVATVTSVGVATIAAAVGAGGLGTFIFQGLTMVNNNVILAGAVPAAILAVLADAGFGWIERRLTAAFGIL